MRAMAAMWRFGVFAACIVAVLCRDANAASPAPSADCSSVLFDMLPCVDYISIGGTKTKPPKECCSGVKGVLKTNGECVCQALRQSGSMGIQVNFTRALALPATCAISTPLPDCGIPLPPGTAPSRSPGVPSPSRSPGVPSPSRSPGVPSPSRSPGSPSPSRSPGSPSPSRSPGAPSPVVPRPFGAPSPTPVKRAPAQAPGPEVASPPGGGEGDESPAPAPSDAATFSISSNPSLAIMLTLLASLHALGSFRF